ncbi:MAG: hypothetical protein KJI69_06150 [Patescibacteria group bacterium]|nr:hypothetical protein [Patescibacteria group bacterium]
MYYDSLVMGGGEVGSSIKIVLQSRKNRQKIGIIDRKDTNYKEIIKNTTCKTLHVCYPYSISFEKETLKYCKLFEPELVIIHSTVPVGTTESLNYTCFAAKISPLSHIVHSPVRGQHPRLDKAILSFVKYVGTDSEEAFRLVKKEMPNVKLKWIKNARDTELGKILSTSYYGLCIAWHREMERLCKHFGAEFENAVTDFNITYNKGYKNIRPDVVRPTLSPPKGKIGGHCITQNAKMLKKQIQSNFLDLIK